MTPNPVTPWGRSPLSTGRLEIALYSWNGEGSTARLRESYMTVGNPASDPAFESLRQFRPLLLKAHKILMDAEKDRYEANHGAIANKGDYLRLVLNHEQFSWLRPISQLIVQIDEVLMSKQPQPLERAPELLNQARHLLYDTEIGQAFQDRTQSVSRRDPEMAAMAQRLDELMQPYGPQSGNSST
ncbi:hypothetical protein [Nodosilinea sp. FACHB-13]|uniref:hypothetical protein n=1 Tax=Cyanophyceae TaxID=3028117 RepID=UPI00168220F8|nr:hypothetical protein [Nodosilinea sp. FACHB-13]MBD2105965.1 hypothetical protein [Nodosilinea sp. FACHB-13]